LGTLKWEFENDFKNLGWFSIPLMDFQNEISNFKEGMIIPELEAGEFYKLHW
jgi:hypothetical protein